MSKELMNGPIPGQSLTDKPGNFPWEKPPDTELPEEALMMHIEIMSGPEFMEGAALLMEVGLPIKTLADTIITGGVAKGIHSIDVGLIISPAIKKELISIAKMTGVSYIEEFSKESEEEEKQKRNLKVLVEAKMRKKGFKGNKEEVSETMEAMTSPEVENLEDMREEQDAAGGGEDMAMQEPQQQQEEQAPQQEAPAPQQADGMGLMSRGA